MGFLDFLRDKPSKTDLFRQRLRESLGSLVGEKFICKFARPDYYLAHLGDDGYFDWEEIVVEEISSSGFHLCYRQSMSGKRKQVTVDSFVSDICFPKETSEQPKVLQGLYYEVFGLPELGGKK